MSLTGQRKIFSALVFTAVLLVAIDLPVIAFGAPANGPTATSGLGAALEDYRPYVLSILRIVVALLFLQHGMAKMFNFPPQGDMPAFPKPEWFAGRIELVGSTLVILGLFTRPVAFILSGEMAFAYFMSHRPRGFFPLLNGGEAAVLFCFVFLYLAFAGAGPLSLDALL
ncbi:MAG TPA: DoxX family protein [Nitrospirota bacterium]|nr:DoxX family protein [Nitrospirota bacterium]